MVTAHCKICGKLKEVAGDGKTKGYCHVCYKKLIWKPKPKICKRCRRERPMHAKGLCNGCYNSVFHIEKVKENNTLKYHNIDYETYNKLTEKCIICGFDKIVELHHIDHNHKNNSSDNLIGICPNHHKMLHDRDYRHEMFEILREKGFKVPETYEKDEVFKN